MLSDWVSFLAYPNLFGIKGFVVVYKTIFGFNVQADIIFVCLFYVHTNLVSKLAFIFSFSLIHFILDMFVPTFYANLLSRIFVFCLVTYIQDRK
jgi:hypothetical protein